MTSKTSLPIMDKYEMQKRLLAKEATNNKNSVNRKDYTKKILSRSVTNPCSFDHNMRSHGAPSYVQNQLTFTGGIASFMGETPQFMSACGPRDTNYGGVHVRDLLTDGSRANSAATSPESRAQTARDYKDKLSAINRAISSMGARPEPSKYPAIARSYGEQDEKRMLKEQLKSFKPINCNKISGRDNQEEVIEKLMCRLVSEQVNFKTSPSFQSP